MSWLINASQLEKFRKGQKNIIVLDATWHLATENRNAKEEFKQSHILGARFFDLASFNDATSELPNMLMRDEKTISEKIGALGITNEHKVIFYDQSDLHTSCRALWMFKVFGHNPNQLYILNGGFEAWQRYGGKLESGDERAITPKTYNVTFEAHLIRTLMQMKNNLHHPAEQVIDMRHPVRYAGGKEHRPNLRRGHIPGSYCFPFSTMFETDGNWKPIEQIRKQLTGLGIDLNYPIITSCGSGITAAVLDFALDLMNQPTHSLYDGSWSEWGSTTLFPGETNLNERPAQTSLDK